MNVKEKNEFSVLVENFRIFFLINTHTHTHIYIYIYIYIYISNRRIAFYCKSCFNILKRIIINNNNNRLRWTLTEIDRWSTNFYRPTKGPEEIWKKLDVHDPKNCFLRCFDEATLRHDTERTLMEMPTIQRCDSFFFFFSFVNTRSWYAQLFYQSQLRAVIVDGVAEIVGGIDAKQERDTRRIVGRVDTIMSCASRTFA